MLFLGLYETSVPHGKDIRYGYTYISLKIRLAM